VSILKLSPALLIAASLIGCRREPPAPPKPPADDTAAAKPSFVKSHVGIDHEFYRDIGLEGFLKLLPTGSIDSVHLDFGKGPQVFALVKVPEQPGKDLTKIRFETSFKMQDGQVITKDWTAAKDRKTGSAAAVFSLPSGVIDGETKVVDNRD
jgi:hypothetical protein